MHDLVKLLLF